MNSKDIIYAIPMIVLWSIVFYMSLHSILGIPLGAVVGLVLSLFFRRSDEKKRNKSLSQKQKNPKKKK